MWFEMFKFHLNLCTLYKLLRRDCSHCDVTHCFGPNILSIFATVMLAVRCHSLQHLDEHA